MAMGGISRVFQPGRVVYTWYGMNGTSSVGQPYIPCRSFPPDGQRTGSLPKLREIGRPSEVVFLFDGVGINYHQVNANRVNARHNNKRVTNILFFDGHSESFETGGLPGGDGDAGVGAGARATFSLSNLSRFAYPKWRLDQP